MKKIKIIKDGPYLVSGNIPIRELVITNSNGCNTYKKGREIKTDEAYALCRCGHSKNKPFCDGSHKDCHFSGKTTASKKEFSKEAKKYNGKNIFLEDVESLCAFARFCHYGDQNVWDLTEYANTKDEEELAVKLACDCPAGRLVAYDKLSGEAIEPTYEESIVVLQDSSSNCSGPLWVRGGVTIEDEEGSILEKRNRVTLCRCGESQNKPFCDATHVGIKFKDDYFKK
jgi:CDGSH-type Zn-finger protein